jgi:DNA-binding MarR family transcriptional regulator
MKTGTRGDELAALFRETVALYWRLSADAAAMHRRGRLSGPRRTILSALAAGPQTVAHLARQRSQSRQRLQPLINALVRDGLVKPVPNPLHKRSPLMALTPEGQRQERNMTAREAAMRARLKPASSVADLARAAAVLRDVRQTLMAQMPRLLR